VYNNAGSLDVIVDIVGYYEPSIAGGTGPAGPTGPVGPSGPLCPTAGCAAVFSGAATSPTSGTTSTLDNYACRTLPTGTTAELDLALLVRRTRYVHPLTSWCVLSAALVEDARWFRRRDG